MKVIDLVKVLKGYNSGWVSISKDSKKILASDKTLKGLLKKLSKIKVEGYIMKASGNYSNYVG